MVNSSHNLGEISVPLFSPESVFWRVNREWLTALAGPRALLLELAHPLVAAGVAGHSHFRRDPLGRLYRTLRAMTDVTFGQPAQAYETARHIQACHRRVAGTLAKDVGPYLAGTPYRANDPLLKLWVLATLIDSSLQTYDLLIAPLSLADRQAYYDDSQCLARLLGIPPDLTPPTYEDFCNYLEAMLDSDVLTVGETAREIVYALFTSPLVGHLAKAASLVGIGLLPERLRQAYGFQWGERREKRLQKLASLTRRIRPLMPEAVCVHPGALRAERRLRAGARHPFARG